MQNKLRLAVFNKIVAVSNKPKADLRLVGKDEGEGGTAPNPLPPVLVDGVIDTTMRPRRQDIWPH